MTKTYATEGDLGVLKNELDALSRVMLEMAEVQRESLQVSERLNRRIGDLERDKTNNEYRAKSNFWPW